MEIVTLFPTLIYQSKLKRSGSLNLRLIKEITELSKQDKLGRQWSKENYPGGYTSYASLSDLPYRSPTFAQFSEALEPHANQFAKSQGWDTRGRQLRMTSCWINIMPKGTYHTLHLHPHSVISGTYYVSTPPSSVSLKLEDPRMAFYMNAPVRSLRKNPSGDLYYHVKPVAGSFVMFESWLRHEVPPNQSLKPRISLSFNYDLEGAEDE